VDFCDVSPGRPAAKCWFNDNFVRFESTLDCGGSQRGRFVTDPEIATRAAIAQAITLLASVIILHQHSGNRSPLSSFKIPRIPPHHAQAASIP